MNVEWGIENFDIVCGFSSEPPGWRDQVELISRLSRKLEVLEEEKRAINDEIRSNEVLGSQIKRTVENSVASIRHKEKFFTHVENVEKITALLLRLSHQLNRVQSELSNADTRDYAADQKQAYLQERFRQLLCQLQDAREIKKMLDVRSYQVIDILHSVMTENQLADYQYFIQMKSKLLIDGDEIENKIKLGKSQREALKRSL
ncbi:unnamed protein product [Soboliphyme baturini]|uniref:ASD2 domain-containing protein n=1 Tax=Soboliphyme baturini TaxID=241478 RepID=A0A183IM75_9BILA|nr:unnamed protein product [Soboliphyme baturini]